jgi:hypothetical protein
MLEPANSETYYTPLRTGSSRASFIFDEIWRVARLAMKIYCAATRGEVVGRESAAAADTYIHADFSSS